MQDRARDVTAAVIGPMPADAVSGLRFADGFELFGSNPSEVSAALREIAGVAGSRIAVAVGPGALVVGLCGLRPPHEGDRFYAVPTAIELVATEVIEPFRGAGLLARMFSAALGADLERFVVYAVVDPELSGRASAHAFRRKMIGVLGSVGFFPLPTDHPAAHIHRNSSLVARPGREVPLADREAFFERLGRPQPAVRVAVALRDRPMRNLIRTELDRHGFSVTGVSVSPASANGADVVITDTDSVTPAVLTIRLTGSDEARSSGRTYWLPVAMAERIVDVLRHELARRRIGGWPTS